MKNESSGQKTVLEITHREKRTKKVIIPPKSPKIFKPRKASFLIKKFKVKSKSPSKDARVASVSLSLPSTSTSPLGRQTPEGDDSFLFAKTVSKTNLSESWKSAENLTRDTDNLSALSEVSHNRVSAEVLEKTKSLESLKSMPAYGDLIAASTTPVVILRVLFVNTSITLLTIKILLVQTIK